MPLSLTLPASDGSLQTYALRGTPPPQPPAGVRFNRIAYSAAHVVADPLAAIDPWLQSAVDWDATIAYRRLMGASLSEDVDRNTAWAEKYLRDLSDGRVTFGATDNATPQPPGRMVSSAPCKTIDWNQY